MKGFQQIQKKNNISFAWLIILCVPTVLLFVLVLLVGIDANLTLQVQNEKALSAPIAITKTAAYPIFTNVLGATSTLEVQNNNLLQDLTAQAALVMDHDSKVILLSKNPYLRFSMASTTKIMTALVALEYYSSESVLTVFDTAVAPAVVGFKKGERISFEDALYGLLLPSGNDAALAIAQNYPGGEGSFITKMNEKAKEYYLTSTHFGDSTGLNDDEDYTTPYDLARLASLALENKKFAQVVETKYKVIANVDKTSVYSLSNLNKLLGISGVNGIKTGFTDEAGEVLVTSTAQSGHILIIVVMKSQDRFGDTAKLLSLLNSSVTYETFDPNTGVNSSISNQNALVNTGR